MSQIRKQSEHELSSTQQLLKMATVLLYVFLTRWIVDINMEGSHEDTEKWFYVYIS